MEINNYHIIECNRRSSEKVKIEGLTADNKSSWRNVIKPIHLRVGDMVQLETSIVNIKGADSSNIEFSGENNIGLTDNNSLIEIGFYINHNAINTISLPFAENIMTPTKYLLVDTDVLNGDTNNMNIGRYENIFILSWTLPNTPGSYVSYDFTMDDIESYNPNIKVDGTKYAKLSLDYCGWARSWNTGINTLPQCTLLKKFIPIKLKKGFLNPVSIGDQITLYMQRMNPITNYNNFSSGLMNSFVDPEIYSAITSALFRQNTFLKEARFNGYSYCSIYANGWTKDTPSITNTSHPIYNNLAVKNPYKYVHGLRIIADTETYPLNNLIIPVPDPNTDRYAFFGNSLGELDYRVWRPVFLWNSFDFADTDAHNPAHYRYYCPYDTIIGAIAGNHSMYSLSNTNEDYIRYNRPVYRPHWPLDTNGTYMELVGHDLIISDIPALQAQLNFPNIYINSDDTLFYYIISYVISDCLSLTIWNYENGYDEKIDIFFTNYTTITTINPFTNLISNELHYNMWLESGGNIWSDQIKTTEIGAWDWEDENTIKFTIALPNYIPKPNFGWNAIGPTLWKRAINNDVDVVIEQFTEYEYTQIVWAGLNYEWEFQIQVADVNDNYRQLYCIFNVNSESNGQWINENEIDNESKSKGAFYFDNNNKTITFKDLNQNIVQIIKHIGPQNIYLLRNFVIYPDKKDDIIFEGWNIFEVPRFQNFTAGNTLIYKSFNFLDTGSSLFNNAGGNISYGPDVGTYTGGKIKYNDTFTLSKTLDRTIHTTSARLVKNQLVPTNIALTMDNLKIIKDWMDNNKIYKGNQLDEDSIKDDVENYVIKVDIHQTRPLNEYDNDPVSGINHWIEYKKLFPLSTAFMRDREWAIGGPDNIGNDISDVGMTCPRSCYAPVISGDPVNPTLELTYQRQEIELRASYFDFENKSDEIIYSGVLGDSEISVKDTDIKPSECEYNNIVFFKDIDQELKDYIKKYNLGIIPLKLGPNVPLAVGKNGWVCGFLIAKNYLQDGKILKIQNLSYFGFSPASLDSDQVITMNKNSAIYNAASISAPTHMQEFTGFINVGAVNPTLQYNPQFSKYQWSYLHTPVYNNPLNSTPDASGKIVARISDTYMFFHDRWLATVNPVPDEHGDIHVYNPNNHNPLDKHYGVKDSQAGIFISKLYGQRASLVHDALTPNEAIELTEDNYAYSLWYKLGFSFRDLIPYKFSENSFSNRFYDLYYNNIEKLEYRELQLAPFTTNSDLNISSGVSSSLYGYNFATDANPPVRVAGEVNFNLGYNSGMTIALEVQSAFLTAESIPVQISNAYFRIFTSLPLENLQYQNSGDGLNCIGISLRNYASSSFYYSYGMSYNSTITKECVITDIKTEIRNTDGLVSSNIGDNSSVIIKITSSNIIGIENNQSKKKR